MDDFTIPIATFLTLAMFLVGLGLGVSATEPTDLPTGCILYEEKIWCEVNE